MFIASLCLISIVKMFFEKVTASFMLMMKIVSFVSVFSP